jgi:hypothetical protein
MQLRLHQGVADAEMDDLLVAEVFDHFDARAAVDAVGASVSEVDVLRPEAGPVEEREVREDLEDGYQPHRVRDHQRGEDEHEERLAKREPEPGERVAAQ